ncbi:hypothetical protein BDF14DRAFT_806936 [Spinellus fusiger]|nr:hypothetical protein BDF14DRAFT_806936 [Spinellus fusiger]
MDTIEKTATQSDIHLTDTTIESNRVDIEPLSAKTSVSSIDSKLSKIHQESSSMTPDLTSHQSLLSTNDSESKPPSTKEDKHHGNNRESKAHSKSKTHGSSTFAENPNTIEETKDRNTRDAQGIHSMHEAKNVQLYGTTDTTLNHGLEDPVQDVSIEPMPGYEMRMLESPTIQSVLSEHSVYVSPPWRETSLPSPKDSQSKVANPINPQTPALPEEEKQQQEENEEIKEEFVVEKTATRQEALHDPPLIDPTPPTPPPPPTSKQHPQSPPPPPPSSLPPMTEDSLSAPPSPPRLVESKYIPPESNPTLQVIHPSSNRPPVGDLSVLGQIGIFESSSPSPSEGLPSVLFWICILSLFITFGHQGRHQQ